jgi:hypothetical protein
MKLKTRHPTMGPHEVAAVRRATAEQMLGHKPRNSREISQGMIRWARMRLKIPGDVSL